jgi:NAD(P)-dependent dehydrogenase (short-subunit alcohol dehydrogenase family)
MNLILLGIVAIIQKGNQRDRRLAKKIALITGGNSGIGLATAKQFVNEGAYVFITGRREPELTAAVKEIGKNVTAIQGDVSSLDDLDRLFAQKNERKGSSTLFSRMPVSRSSHLWRRSLRSITTRFLTPMLRVSSSRYRRRFR